MAVVRELAHRLSWWWCKWGIVVANGWSVAVSGVADAAAVAPANFCWAWIEAVGCGSVDAVTSMLQTCCMHVVLNACVMSMLQTCCLHVVLNACVRRTLFACVKKNVACMCWREVACCIKDDSRTGFLMMLACC